MQEVLSVPSYRGADTSPAPPPSTETSPDPGCEELPAEVLDIGETEQPIGGVDDGGASVPMCSSIGIQVHPLKKNARIQARPRCVSIGKHTIYLYFLCTK